MKNDADENTNLFLKHMLPGISFMHQIYWMLMLEMYFNLNIWPCHLIIVLTAWLFACLKVKLNSHPSINEHKGIRYTLVYAEEVI